MLTWESLFPRMVSCDGELKTLRPIYLSQENYRILKLYALIVNFQVQPLFGDCAFTRQGPFPDLSFPDLSFIQGVIRSKGATIDTRAYSIRFRDYFFIMNLVVFGSLCIPSLVVKHFSMQPIHLYSSFYQVFARAAFSFVLQQPLLRHRRT